MTPAFSEFSARLREQFQFEDVGQPPLGSRIRNRESENQVNDLISRNPSLRDDTVLNAQALELFALQYEHNTLYRRFCELRGVSPASVEHWSRIPATPTSAFKELEMSCLPAESRTTVFHSSGTTTQRPSRHFHSMESLALYEASLWPWFRAHVLTDWQSGFELNARQRCRLATGNWNLIILTPPPAQAPHSSLVHMFEVIRQRLGAPDFAFVGATTKDGWKLDWEATATTLRCASHGTIPLILLGTAFSFVHLVDALAERELRFELPPGSRVMETGGYKGRSRSLPKTELHALIAQVLGIPVHHILGEYGMSELSSQAYDGAFRPSSARPAAARVFRFPPWARAQVVSPETGLEVSEGETGLLRIVDLANAFSAAAIQTEDLAVAREKGFELIGRAELAENRGCSLMSACS